MSLSASAGVALLDAAQIAGAMTTNDPRLARLSEAVSSSRCPRVVLSSWRPPRFAPPSSGRSFATRKPASRSSQTWWRPSRGLR